MGLTPQQTVLVLSDADDADYARVSGIQSMVEAEQFDR